MGRKTPLTVTSTGKAVKKNPKPKKAKLETSAKQVRKLEGVGVDRIRDPEHGAPSSAAVVSAEQKETRLKSHESDENVCSSQLENSNERTVGNRRASSPPMSRCIAPGTSTIPRDGSTPRSNGTTGVGVGVGINIAKNRKVPGKRKAYDGMQTATQDQVGVERVQSLPFEEDHDARLKTALKFVKAKHREMFGKGRPIVGKYIAALAKLGLKRFVDCSSSGGSGTCDGQEKSPPGDDEEGTVAVTVRAITAAAKEKHSCKVDIHDAIVSLSRSAEIFLCSMVKLVPLAAAFLLCLESVEEHFLQTSIDETEIAHIFSTLFAGSRTLYSTAVIIRLAWW